MTTIASSAASFVAKEDEDARSTKMIPRVKKKNKNRPTYDLKFYYMKF
jgi:hypothetical protein